MDGAVVRILGMESSAGTLDGGDVDGPMHAETVAYARILEPE